MTEETRTDIDVWAAAHGFSPTDDQISGATPLLRMGEIGTTDDAYVGAIDGHDAWLAEFSIGSPNLTAEFGGDGVSLEAFTLFLVAVDASKWPRLTVHPSAYPDHHFFKRAFHIDHRAHTVSPEMDDRYRVISAKGIDDEQLMQLFTPDLIAWWLEQDPMISVDIEDHRKHGGYLTVAQPGLGVGESDLDRLFEQTKHVLAAIAPLT
jgi:hypothetical protein